MRQNNYYPFGLQHKEYNELASSEPSGFNYKFGGKELQDELELNLYDFGARNYEPALGRWMNVDPAAEEYRDISLYAYVANDPMNAIDPDGKRIVYIIRGRDGKKSSMYTYRNGNFYDKNNRIFTPDKKNQATMYKVLQSYRKIENSNDDLLKGQLNTIEKSNQLHFIEQSPNRRSSVEALGDVRNADGKIVNSTQAEFDFNANPEFDPFEIVVHELRHQFDYDIGNS